MRPELPMRLALATNAAFFVLTGSSLTVSPQWFDEILGLHSPLVVNLMGLGLLIFGAEMGFQATRKRMESWRAVAASVLCLAVVPPILVLLGFLPVALPPSGLTIAVSFAVMVILLGLWQLWAAGRSHFVNTRGVYGHCVVVETPVHARDMWTLVGDLARITRYQPGLAQCEILGDEPAGVGTVRLCRDHVGRQWREECIDYRSGESYTMCLVSEDADFPLSPRLMRTGWQVTPTQNGSRIRVWWELTPRSSWHAPFTVPLTAFHTDWVYALAIERMVDECTSSEDFTGNPNWLMAPFPPHGC